MDEWLAVRAGMESSKSCAHSFLLFCLLIFVPSPTDGLSMSA
jgi:hypothetical protein